MTQAAILAASGSPGTTTGFKNKLINGNMAIDQRNAGASVSTGAGGFNYTLDRWNYYASVASKFTLQQNAGSVTPPVGFSNYLGCTSSSAYTVGAGETFTVQQSIEGFNTSDLNWGSASAKTITISAWVYSSLTGTFGGALQNSAYSYSYPFTYSIPTANTWTQISVTIAGPTAGTWIGSTNGTGIRVIFSLGSGSTFSGTAGSWSANQYWSATGAVSVVGTNGATWYMTGCQFEVGTTATNFDFRSYGTELALCQRYYQTLGSQNNGDRIPCFAGNGGSVFSANLLLVPMRAAPTLAVTGIMAFDEYYVSGRTQSSADVGRNSGGTLSVIAIFSNFTGLTRGDPGGLYGSTTGVLQISAEL
jgi:hypothetical protein